MVRGAEQGGRWVRAAMLAAALAAAVMAVGCTARRSYPEPVPGWHSPDYGVIFGQLQRLPPKTEDSDPVWVVRFGAPGDQYGGELALTPPTSLLGFSGGERVEVSGGVREEMAHPEYAGKWYQVQSIRLWVNRR